MSLLRANFPFPNLREKQSFVLDEIASALSSGFKFIILEAPTGFGKSPVAIASALALGSSYICTSTKNLQTQYAKDFPFIKTVKGKSNFQCEVKEDFIKAGKYRCKGCSNAKRPEVFEDGGRLEPSTTIVDEQKDLGQEVKECIDEEIAICFKEHVERLDKIKADADRLESKTIKDLAKSLKGKIPDGRIVNEIAQDKEILKRVSQRLIYKSLGRETKLNLKELRERVFPNSLVL